jgi:glucose/arabinose dehydrogenase
MRVLEMYNRSTFHLLMVSFLLLILFSACSSQNKGDQFSDAELNGIMARSAHTFDEYCSGCHDDSLSHFAQREWIYGEKAEEIYISIAEGREDGEMPAFNDAFDDAKIKELVIAIMNTKGTLANYNLSNSDDSKIFKAKDLSYKLETIADGFESPWGMAFLPNNEMLIADKSGELWRVNGSGEKSEISGVPKVKYRSQGGLMDIELHPDFNENNYVYLSYSVYNEDDDDLGTTVVSRYKLEGNSLTEAKEIYKALPYVSTGRHYGCRLEFDNDGYLFITVGDRGRRDIHPQDLSTHPGKVHRVFDDGRIPDDNPFVNSSDAVASIYSYGHRNQQGMIKHPVTGEIWTHEHGPRGGDEINIVNKGLNYGWPVISHGVNYSGTKFTDITEKEGMEQPLHQWTPSIAPSGMDFVRGDKYPGWEGRLLVGSLKFEYVGLYELDNKRIVSEERLMVDEGRVRNVKQGPDGFIYVAVEEPGIVYKIVPVEGSKS